MPAGPAGEGLADVAFGSLLQTEEIDGEAQQLGFGLERSPPHNVIT